MAYRTCRGSPKRSASSRETLQPNGVAILRKPKRRWLSITWKLGLFSCAVLAVIACYCTTVDPAIRHLQIELPDTAGQTKTTTIILLSDIHVSGPDMPPERLKRIVEQINALQPDIVALAGDVVSDKRTATWHYSTRESVSPLAGINARLGKVAVPGNHDHWRNIEAVREELRKAGFTVLQNAAVRLGPLTIGGLDDDFTRHADLPATLAAMGKLSGPQILLSHSPDPFADLPAGRLLMLAGHTHCGQIAYPWGGSPATMSRYGDRYACGLIRERGNTLVVTAGLGTSVLPVRMFVRPDLWQIKLKPPAL